MVDEPDFTFPAEQQLALAYTPPRLRNRLATVFALDRRLARIVSGTSEPMLGQMRLAWWRENLEKRSSERPSGDVVLDAIGRDWSGEEAALIMMVNGWEHMLADPFGDQEARSFGEGRAAPLVHLAPAKVQAAESAAQRWALVDAATHIAPGAERTSLLELAGSIPASSRLPSALRGIAVLDALARRSIKNGGQPLMEGRGASLAAMKAAIFGR